MIDGRSGGKYWFMMLRERPDGCLSLTCSRYGSSTVGIFISTGEEGEMISLRIQVQTPPTVICLCRCVVEAHPQYAVYPFGILFRLKDDLICCLSK
jgi:hypothetical protein